MKKESITYALIAVLVISVIGYGAVKLITAEDEAGKYDAFADCLTDKGAAMYGANWCSHCKDQKAMFGESFRKVNYVNCELAQEKCSNAGIRGYPTWIINGTKYTGTKQLSELSDLSGCSLKYKVGWEKIK